MSDNARPKSGGDKLRADEINQDLPVQGTGGETISGATTPAPVYVDYSDGELYECDAGDTDKLNFVGFVVDDTSDGNSATLQKDGVVSGFSSLTIGSKYYLQDGGGIGTTPGTYPRVAGRAISSTELLILHQPTEIVEASDNLRHTGSSGSGTSTSYTKVTEIEYRDAPGEIRVKFSLSVPTSSGQAYGKIYKNGSPVGTERNTSSSSPVEYSEDLEFITGDLIQIYAKKTIDNISVSGNKLCYDKKIAINPSVNNAV